jgi:adenosylcobinamide kinase/adenosylcobinamide-phosphate guanylyltransferase
MRITILGSGAASGWPNPLCGCASCHYQRHLGAVRAPSSAYVHGLGILDWGPTTAVRAAEFGIDLSCLEHVFITHAHPDHFDPQFLLWEQWAARTTPLHVWGPSAMVRIAQDWVGQSAAVQLHQVSAGQVLPLDPESGWSVISLAANHDPFNTDPIAADTVLYSLRDARDVSALYATDTATFTISESCASALRAHGHLPWRFVAMEQTFGHRADHHSGHHDLVSFRTQLEYFTIVGAIDDHSSVIAIHLGHENDPNTLESELCALGATAARDGMQLGERELHTHDVGGHVHLVLGGARSGKSRYAQGLLDGADQVTYVATGYPPESDDQAWQARIMKHRADRPEHWHTVESIDLARCINTAPGAVLIDCLGLWLTRTIDSLDGWSAHEGDLLPQILGQLDSILTAARSHTSPIVFVSNEVGAGVTPSTESGRLFQDLLGRVNQTVADSCDQTTYLIAGQPLRIT